MDEKYKYQRIAEQIKLNIFCDYQIPNKAIPSIREYAKKFNANPNTIARALNLLKEENIIYSCRTAGYFVVENIQDKRADTARNYTKDFIHILTDLGYCTSEILALICAEKE